jgi:hypothetical protein
MGKNPHLWNNSPTDFSWGYNGSGPAQLALAILTDYFGEKSGGKALAEALYEPFKFTVITVLPDCWEMNFEKVGIAPCRTLTDEPDLLNRVISNLENFQREDGSVALPKAICSLYGRPHRAWRALNSGGKLQWGVRCTILDDIKLPVPSGA